MTSRPLQVLVVEPDFMLALQYQLELLAGGHSANIVSSGEDALAVATLDYDLIITELRLPGITGSEFIREVRSRAGFEDMPILVIAVAESLPPSISNGTTRLERKPFAWDRFLGFVAEAAGPKRFRH